MLIRLASTNATVEIETGGDPEYLRWNVDYFVHAIAVDVQGEVSMAVREPQVDSVFLYFYNSRYLQITDPLIPIEYEMAIDYSNDLFRVIIAPPFWSRDTTFYERLSNAGTSDPVAKIFRRHVERIQQGISDDVVV